MESVDQAIIHNQTTGSQTDSANQNTFSIQQNGRPQTSQTARTRGRENELLIVTDGEVEWTSGVPTQYAQSRQNMQGKQQSFTTDETAIAKVPAISVNVESRAQEYKIQF